MFYLILITCTKRIEYAIQYFCRFLVHSQTTVSGLSKTYEPVDKDISCDIDIVNIRTMERRGYQVEPDNNAVLILHRQGFNGCYKPMGLTCKTNGGKVWW